MRWSAACFFHWREIFIKLIKINRTSNGIDDDDDNDVGDDDEDAALTMGHLCLIIW